MRQLYVVFPQLLDVAEISHALRDQSLITAQLSTLSIATPNWKPGQLHPNLSWTHYRTLVRVENEWARAFYEIETLKNNWSTVKYTLGAEQQDQIFASRYKLHLPTSAELGRELSQLRTTLVVAQASLMGDE